MKYFKFLALVCLSFLSISAFAQNTISAVLVDESNGEALGFATVSLIKDGQSKPTKYALSNDKGVVSLESVRNGLYTFKAELMGYIALSKTVKIDGKSVDLGQLKMKVDSQQLDAASVSALGQQIVVKKDTIEYNASSFKTTANDVLEDLLKKLPGIEVGDDGTIKSNGETISKITIDGKTFFLNDPQLASKNIPAKLVQKLKVIRKKSEQAEFSGIDDGQEQTVIDLSVQPGMMKGIFGNVQAGAGYDVPNNSSVKPEARYQGNMFAGRFTTDSQISLILNGNNTNGGGSTNFSGNMMSGMRGGGGGMGGSGNGITTSYMGGLNAAFDLFDDKMTLGGNYLYNGSTNDVEENSVKTTYLDNYNLIYNTTGANSTNTNGNRFGIRLEHKFSDNTSIIFEPQINFGGGNYFQKSTSTTFNDNLTGTVNQVNDAYTNNSGNNKNVTASGYLLFRQRLGIPGRTLTLNLNYNLTNNDLSGLNDNGTKVYATGGNVNTTKVNQTFNSTQDNYSLSGRLTYTEPMGNGFYIEANYAYNWSKSSSDKQTYDMNNGGAILYNYSNSIMNLNRRQEIGANALYQSTKARFQIGVSAMPNYTYNSTTKYNATTGVYAPTTYEDFRWNFSPQAMVFLEPSDNFNMRFFYRGTSSQPSTSQLMPVPDNTDPLNVSFGNPTLTPYFNHNINGDFRYSNNSNFSSFNVRFNGGFTQNPIVSAVWYSTSGGQYTMPFNGPASSNASVNLFANLPIGRSNFTINNNAGGSFSSSSSYVGKNIDMTTYTNSGYYDFMNEFIDNFRNSAYYAEHITENNIKSLSVNDRLRLTYRGTALEATVGGSTRMNKSWYSISTTNANTTTWNNQISASLTWNWEIAGLSLKSDYSYNWYNGYSTAQPSQNILSAEISKTLFNNKVSVSLRGSDLLGQSKNLTVTDNSNYHSEVVNNTLGRYVILAFTYRFGTMGGGRGGRGGGMGGFGGGMRMM